MSIPDDPLSNAAKILQSEPVKDLLSPPAKEIGEFLGTVANLARFYMTENLERIFKEWARSRRHRSTLGDKEFKKVMPLLPLASMVSDEELQKRWAALMESTATDDGCLPSFGQTLAQLTPEEVQYLDRLWKVASAPLDYVSEHPPGREPMSFINLVRVFDPGINTGVNPAEWKLYKERFTEEQRANYERLTRAELLIADLIRLGIISVDQVAEPDKYLLFNGMKFPTEISGVTLHPQYSFSQYGASFMLAVTTCFNSATADTEKHSDG
jgi:hypothetical protein